MAKGIENRTNPGSAPGKEITSMEPSRLRVGKGKRSPPKEHVGAVIREKRKENPGGSLVLSLYLLNE